MNSVRPMWPQPVEKVTAARLRMLARSAYKKRRDPLRFWGIASWKAGPGFEGKR